jgi:predicted nucleotide-binding protein
MGKELRNAIGNSAFGAKLASHRAEFRKWTEYNFELLSRIFTSKTYAEKYAMCGVSMIMIVSSVSDDDELMEFVEELDAKIENIESLIERLDLIDLDLSTDTNAATSELKALMAPSRKVFVVHGRDEEAKAIVARFLDHCELEPVILHEQANNGLTIIEKFEANADVSFAVVLLTPDDVGALKGGEELAPRARQNVILELGYFIGRLSRRNVCALKKGEIEIPSDFFGVSYTQLGLDDGWKLALARELKSAGIEIDLNKALA